jgi:murein DD-endopeptidase MepM/ murein hydrolase activator NlpD
VAVLTAFLGVMSSPVVAGQDLGSAREQREATRAEQVRVAAELDVLRADAEAIRSALAGLDEAIAYQLARIEAAQRALDDATAEAAAAEAEAEATGARIDELRTRLTDTVLDAYTGGLGRDTAEFLASADAGEAERRRELLDVVQGRYQDDLEELRGLKERQRRALARAGAAVAAAEAEKAVLDGAREELDAQWAVQASLAAGLQSRLGNVQAEADRLEAAEAELTAVINRHLATQAAATGRPSAVGSIVAAAASGFLVPADGPITSPFGYRTHPILGSTRLHAGTDIGAPYGSPVWASKSGQVIFSGWNGGYGYCVIIAHTGGFSTLYGHLADLAVGVGDRVEQGETIGWVGSTGWSTGPHLHFEIWVAGVPTDPMNFL